MWNVVKFLYEGKVFDDLTKEEISDLLKFTDSHPCHLMELQLEIRLFKMIENKRIRLRDVLELTSGNKLINLESNIIGMIMR